MAQYDQALLEAALVGYEQQRQKIEAAIADLRARMGGYKQTNKQSSTPDEKPAQKKRHISAEGRRRIAEAQKRRWAAQKKAA